MALTVVNQSQNVVTGLNSNNTVAITAAASGNYLVVFVDAAASAAARTVSSITCTNVSFSKLGAQTNGGSPWRNAEIWYGKATAASGTTVSVALSGTAISQVAVVEFGGIDTASPADGTAVGATGSSPLGTGTFNASTNDVALCLFRQDASTSAPSQSGFTALTAATDSANNMGVWPYYKSVAAGSVSTSFTFGGVAGVTVLGGLKLAATAIPERRIIIVEEF